MGIIYIATSPSGKKYVGQTIHTMEHRWNQHVNDSRTRKGHQCTALHNAIRKYGAHRFTVIVAVECDNEELDDWEIMMIEEENSLYPNGYNLTKGGQYRLEEWTDEIRDRMSEAHRKHVHEEFPTVKYINYIKNDKCEGFRVNIPKLPGVTEKYKSYRFTDMSLTMQEKYNLAIRTKDALINNTPLPEFKRKRHNRK